jgi:hypothetical protein
VSDIYDYRPPDEVEAQHAALVRIHGTLDRAVDSGALLIAAMNLDEPQATVDLWVDRLWNRLRDELGPEDRLRAIVDLLAPRFEQAAARITDTGDLR